MPRTQQSITLSGSHPAAPPGRENIQWQADLSNPNRPVFSANVQISGGSVISISEVPAGTLDGINAVFTLSETPAPGSLQIFVNGVEWFAGTYWSLSGTTLTFTLVPKPTDWIRATYTVTG